MFCACKIGLMCFQYFLSIVNLLILYLLMFYIFLNEKNTVFLNSYVHYVNHIITNAEYSCCRTFKTVGTT